MKKWTEALRSQLKHKFYEDEIEEIIEYYTEIIQDRLDQGENQETVLASYPIKRIVKDMTGQIISKRNHDNPRMISKSTQQLLLILLSTPILIPLAIVYLALLIVLGSLMIVGVALFISGIAVFITQTVLLFQVEVAWYQSLGVLGIALIGIAVMELVAYYLCRLSYFLMKQLIVLFSRIVNQRGEEK